MPRRVIGMGKGKVILTRKHIEEAYMKRNAPVMVALKVLIALSAAFAILMLILFLFSGSILPSGEDVEADEQLGMTLGYVLTSVIFTAVPSVIVFVALAVVDICLLTVRAQRKALVGCMVVLPLFLPLFIASTISYFTIVNYAKWLYAILIPAYLVYVAAIVLCAVALAKANRERAAQAAENIDGAAPPNAPTNA